MLLIHSKPKKVSGNDTNKLLLAVDTTAIMVSDTNLLNTMKSSNSVANPRKDIITFSHGMTTMSDNLLRRLKQGKLFLAKMFFPLLVISLLFTTACKEDESMLNTPIVQSINITEFPDGYHVGQLDSKYNTQEKYGYIVSELLFNVIGNDEYIVKKENDSIDFDASFTLISSYFSDVIQERIGEEVSVEDIKNEMLNLQQKFSNDFVLDLDYFDNYLVSKSESFRTKFQKIYDISVVEDDAMTTNIYIDSLKSIEEEIHFSEMPLAEKNELFALSSELKYADKYVACAAMQEEDIPKTKIGEQLQAKQRCCCGSSCFCSNARKDFAWAAAKGALAGAIGGVKGAIIGGLIGAFIHQVER